MFFLKRRPKIFDTHNVEDITLTYSLFYYYSIFSLLTFLCHFPKAFTKFSGIPANLSGSDAHSLNDV